MSATRLSHAWFASERACFGRVSGPMFALCLVLCICTGCSCGVLRSKQWAAIDSARDKLKEFGGEVWEKDTDEYTKGSLIVVFIRDCRNAEPALSHLDGLLEYQALSLPDSTITQAGMDVIAKQKSLRHLHLNRTNVTDEMLHPVNSLVGLVMLQLNDTKITDNGLAQLGDLSQIHNLALGGTEVTDAGLAYLVRYPKLRDLFLENTKITDDGLAHLTALPRLRTLYLSRTRIGDNGLKHLEGLTLLRGLYVEGTQVTPAGIASLQAKLPKCQIIR